MAGGYELVLTRLMGASAASLFRCWTEPALLRQWFAPAPMAVVLTEVDLRVGGATRMVMRAPDGQEFPADGTYLEIVPGRKQVFTDAYSSDWVPKDGKPFMTAVITFDDEDGQTRYTARVRHWNAEDRAAHEAMGFHQGWGMCADQLAVLAASL